MTNAQLTKLVEKQQEQINHLRGRLSSLKDEIVVLNNEVQTFRNQVSADMNTIVKMSKNG